MKQTRVLGLPASTSLVIGNMVGSGIFLLPAALASIGSISLLGWVVTAAGSILLAIILVSIVGLFHVNSANLAHFNISGQPNIVALANAAMLTFFAFAGLESATIPAENIKNPGIIIYRATVLGTLITAVVYILSTIAIMGMFSPELLANNPAPFAAAGKIIFGDLTNQIFALAAIIACFCILQVFYLLQVRRLWQRPAMVYCRIFFLNYHDVILLIGQLSSHR